MPLAVAEPAASGEQAVTPQEGGKAVLLFGDDGLDVEQQRLIEEIAKAD